MAVPGFILQLYIISTSNWTSGILPFWVFYATICSTVTVEYWKRKNVEINNRWGTL